MSKQDIIRKLTSRKFWLALIALISGIVTVIWGEKTAEVVGGLLLQFASVVAYTIGEGLVDAANKPPDAGEAEDEEEHPSITFWKTKDSEDEACEECDISAYLDGDGENK